MHNALNCARIAAHGTRLHAHDGIGADCLVRPHDVHARQLGGLLEQRFHGNLDAGENGAAAVRAGLVDDVKRRRRANVNDDERCAVFLNRGNRVDQTVNADLPRVVIAVYQTGIHVFADNHRAHADVLANRVDERVHDRRHDRSHNDRLRVRRLQTQKRIVHVNLHAELIRCALRRRGQAEAADELFVFINAKNRIGIAYVNRQ